MTEHNGGGTPDGGVVAVGRVGKALGIKGEVFVEPWTDTPDERFVTGAVLATEPASRGPLTVAATRNHSGKLVVLFEGLDDRNAVEAIRGTMLVMSARERPPIDDPDEFYDTDLIGLRAQAADGTPVGQIADVLHSAAGSLLAIDIDGREVLLPFLKQFVPTVDIAAGVAEVVLPDGLLDL